MINGPKDISDEDDLYRRIHLLQYNKVEDRVNSSAFTDFETSVNWANYCSPEETVKDYPNHHLAALQAKIPREKKQEVRHDPMPDNYSHSLIIGNKSQSVRRFLAKNCKFVVKRR